MVERYSGFSRWTPGRRTVLGGLASGAAMSAAGLSLTAGISGQAIAAEGPVVETVHGRVRGMTEDGVHIFKGVRYGAPTGGENRFMPPRTPEPWSGVKEAVTFGDSAPQTNPASEGGGDHPVFRPVGRELEQPDESEDCLFLNVWTTGTDDARRRPVMVWLHGGAFISGSGSGPMANGRNLAQRGDVVVVTLNHRLNAFGFNNFAEVGGSDYARSGNVGMLDIIAALEWVRDNIDRFGGDPGRVTIFGESGGGQKVSMLLASPPAQGLFHRAIIESGPGVKMVERDSAAEVADVYLQELGLDARDFSDIHTLPTEALLAAYFRTQPKVGPIRAGFVDNFGPVIDPVVLPRHPFWPDAPEMSADIPVILGWNRTEMTRFVMDDPAFFSLDEEQMAARARGIFGEDDAAEIIETYRATYPDASPSDLLFLMWSDYPTMSFCNHIAESRARQGQADTYLYRFDWETPIMDGRLRTPHTLEIPFVFDNTDLMANFTGGGDEAARLADRMSEAWVSFAATGDPNSEGSGLPEWRPYQPAERATMLFDVESRLADDPQKRERLLFEKRMERL